MSTTSKGSGGLSHNDAFLLDLWLSGCPDAELGEMLSLTPDTLRAMKQQLLTRLLALRVGEPATAAPATAG